MRRPGAGDDDRRRPRRHLVAADAPLLGAGRDVEGGDVRVRVAIVLDDDEAVVDDRRAAGAPLFVLVVDVALVEPAEILLPEQRAAHVEGVEPLRAHHRDDVPAVGGRAWPRPATPWRAASPAARLRGRCAPRGRGRSRDRGSTAATRARAWSATCRPPPGSRPRRPRRRPRRRRGRRRRSSGTRGRPRRRGSSGRGRESASSRRRCVPAPRSHVTGGAPAASTPRASTPRNEGQCWAAARRGRRRRPAQTERERRDERSAHVATMARSQPPAKRLLANASPPGERHARGAESAVPALGRHSANVRSGSAAGRRRGTGGRRSGAGPPRSSSS